MERAGEGRAPRVQVPQLVGKTVPDARAAGHTAGVVVVSADIDGPPLGALTWPGIWLVIGQRPVAGTWVARWANVVIDFEESDTKGQGPRRPG